jgi:hypothetical protein
VHPFRDTTTISNKRSLNYHHNGEIAGVRSQRMAQEEVLGLRSICQIEAAQKVQRSQIAIQKEGQPAQLKPGIETAAPP